MKVYGVVNEAACVYYVFSNIKEKSQITAVVVDEETDIPFFVSAAESIRNIFGSNIDVLEFDSRPHNLIKTARLIKKNTPALIITSAKYIDLKMPDTSSTLKLNVSDIIKRKIITDTLVKYGFRRTNFVENPGEFAVRGSVVDVFNPDENYPVRIFFDGDAVTAIKKFEIETQNTFEFVMSYEIPSMVMEGVTLRQVCANFYTYNFFMENSYELSQSALSGENYSFENIAFASYDMFTSELERFSLKGFDIHIFCLNEREIVKVSSIIEESGKKIKKLRFYQGYLRKGFYSNNHRVCVISSNEIFSRDFVSVRRKEIKKSLKLNQISAGDYVVHQDYGIGIYNGIIDYTHRDELGNVYKTECIEIKYSGGDKLYVSLEDFKKIEKYIGDSDKVKISSLSSVKWKQIKERVKKEIEKIARQIIKVEAKRKVVRVKPMMKTDMEYDFEASFSYEETPDQKRAIEDVLRDLEGETPANRVIVGDVGFGKTEVAMRAAFRAVSNGYQVCILCPTTILCEQHLRSFKKRFEKFPFNIESLSRFTPYSKEKKIKKDLERGVIDILISTHKVFSEDILFKNLGVLIVDEEHKFGVKQKEIIKSKYSSIHVFYLSATPIPRTLYQSLSNIRTMSVIETPPLGRLPVETKVVPYSDDYVIDAVNKEIKRGGQVFYVYNRVETINIKLEKLKKILPGVRICVVHGQMSSDKIEDIMFRFLEKEYDLMLSSTIIESGIDIPSVNTLLVEDSHRFGLAQLYQLRGRIGREKTKAYCYFFYPEYIKTSVENNNEERISSDALKRLSALEEFSELGSGFRLSMRDLEIRGAGEILGTRQHGFIAAVGLETYVRLLNEEISKIKGEYVAGEKEPLIDLKISAYIPYEYINDDMERLIFYRKLANSKYPDIDNIVNEMQDIAGSMPEEVENLVKVVKIKKLMAGRKLARIVEKEGSIEFYFENGYRADLNDIERWQNEFKGRINFFKTSSHDGISIKLEKNDDKISLISRVLNIDL